MAGAFKMIGGHTGTGEGVRRGSAGGKLVERVTFGHVEHLVLQKVGDTGGRIKPLASQFEASVGSSIVRGEHGKAFGEGGLGDNADLQSVGQSFG